VKTERRHTRTHPHTLIHTTWGRGVMKLQQLSTALIYSTHLQHSSCSSSSLPTSVFPQEKDQVPASLPLLEVPVLCSHISYQNVCNKCHRQQPQVSYSITSTANFCFSQVPSSISSSSQRGQRMTFPDCRPKLILEVSHTKEPAPPIQHSILRTRAISSIPIVSN
jgi:hypothetical protein